MDAIEQLAARTEAAFTEIHHRTFLGDPAANPRLRVEVVELAMVADTPTLILITPWTLNGLFFPPDDDPTTELVIGARRRPVFVNELAELGRYRSVNLVTDVSSLQGPASARTVASQLAPHFRAAVADARQASTVADPGRRAVFRDLRGR